MNRRQVWRLVVSSLLLLLVVFDAAGVSYTSPSNGAPSKKNRLALTVDYEDTGGYGYLPVRATVRAAKPLQRDRLITFRLYTSSTFSRHDGFYELAVEQDIELPAGATSATLDMNAPKLNDWNAVWWEVWVDGTRDDELLGSTPWQGGYQGQRVARVLRSDTIAGEADVSFENLAREEGAVLDSVDPAEAEQFQMAQTEYSVSFSYQQLPRDWQDYTCYDAVALPLEELQGLNTESAAALKRWVLAGGMLIVEHVGDDLERVGEVDGLLARESALLSAAVESDEPPDGESQATQTREADFVLPGFDHWRKAGVWLPRDPEARGSDPSRRRRRGNRFTPRVRPAWFAESQYGFGLVAAFPSGVLDLPAAATGRRRPYSLALAHYLDRRSWANRHGATPNSGCEEFSNWLVPGVGAAPVDAFRWLITLFVLLVGPVCYFWLRALHRTHLLALTAPVAALAFTLCLYAYATFGDGFGTRCRVRSVTLLDQTTGEATSWSRQTYYSGLAPAEGMVFPRTSVAYPLLPGWRETFLASRQNSSRDVVIDDHSQRLATGWLRSRETSQLLVVDCQQTDEKLAIKPQAGGLAVSSTFSSTIASLLAFDQDGQWWNATAIAPGDSVKLQPIESNAAMSQLRAAVLDALPTYPPGMEEGNEFTRQARRYARSGFAQQGFNPDLIGYGPTRFSESRLEMALQLVGGSESGRMLPLNKNCYVAISRSAVSVPIGVAGASEEDSFHVTIGRWAP